MVAFWFVRFLLAVDRSHTHKDTDVALVQRHVTRFWTTMQKYLNDYVVLYSLMSINM